MQNTYKVVGNVVYIRIHATNGKNPLPETDLRIDLKNLEKAQAYTGTWSQAIHQKTGRIYIRGNHSRKRDGQPVFSRLVAQPKPGEQTRHIDGNTLNCLECNLINAPIGVRDITDYIPIGPTPIAGGNSQDDEESIKPVRGVSFHKTKKRWEVKPTVEGKRINLGYWPEGMLLEANEAIIFFRAFGLDAYNAKYKSK